MGSRPEINQFIAKMTEANMARLSKLNKDKTIFNDAYGPFAFCNRKLVNAIEQDEVQRKALQELIHYVAKVNKYSKLIKFQTKRVLEICCLFSREIGFNF